MLSVFPDAVENVVAINELINEYYCAFPFPLFSYITFAWAKPAVSSRIRTTAEPTAKLHSLSPPPDRILPQQHRPLLPAAVEPPAVRCHGTTTHTAAVKLASHGNKWAKGNT